MHSNSEIDQLKAEVAFLKAELDKALSLIASLQARLDHYEKPKNSRNSSIPPSHDYNRPSKDRSLRESSGKKPGGQPGHKGNTLEMVDTPDEVVCHYPLYCNCCGKDLQEAHPELVERRQEVVIPPITPLYIEHQIFERVCGCGHKTVSTFPLGITPGISYGSDVESLACYLNVRQFIPIGRLKEMFRNVFGLPISEGALINSIHRVAQRSIPAYELIRGRAQSSTVSGADETGMKVDGKKGWFWTVQGKLFTFIMASLNRGRQTLDEHFPLGFSSSVLVHDCWRCYFNVPAWAHQICLAHILRELNHIQECYELKWASDLKEVLTDAMAFKKTLMSADYSKELPQRTALENRLNEILEVAIDREKHPLAANMKERLIKYRQHIFTFLYYHPVPPDNNGSERAIRNVKVKLKVSGQFKSVVGAQAFAILRSVMDTAIKNNINPLSALSQVNQLGLQG